MKQVVPAAAESNNPDRFEKSRRWLSKARGALYFIKRTERERLIALTMRR